MLSSTILKELSNARTDALRGPDRPRTRIRLRRG
jgi:hypothetical protein